MRHMIFGESHGPAIGVVLEGVPAGLELDLRPFSGSWTGGSPARTPPPPPAGRATRCRCSPAYSRARPPARRWPCSFATPTSTPRTMRPSATPPARPWDYAGFIKSQGCQDYRGRRTLLRPPHRPPGGRRCGGQAGAGPAGRAGGRPYQLHLRHHRRLLEDAGALEAVAAKPFPVLDDAKGEEMRQAILEAKMSRTAWAAPLSAPCSGCPPGWGAPTSAATWRASSPSTSLPSPPSRAWTSVRGGLFPSCGASEANDPFEVKDGRVVTKTNHAGGVNGGITNGMPVTFEVTIRPTPSIALPQESVDLRTGRRRRSRSRAVTTPASSPAPCP